MHTLVMAVGITEYPVPRMVAAKTSTGMNRKLKGTIHSMAHYKDMMEIPDDLCREVYVFAEKVMNVLKSVYGAESVYLCTMCDGPMNHFHVQLIPRYIHGKRGSRNFVKDRGLYAADIEKLSRLRKLLAEG